MNPDNAISSRNMVTLRRQTLGHFLTNLYSFKEPNLAYILNIKGRFSIWRIMGKSREKLKGMAVGTDFEYDTVA